MPDPTKRRLILEALRDRLAVIQVANGFHTDAGLAIYAGEGVELGDGDPDTALSLVVGPDSPSYQGEHIATALTVEILGLARADLADPFVAEDLVGDIKRAIELPDRTLGGLVKKQIERGPTRNLPREAGSTTVGAGVEYRAPLTEQWGAP